MRLRWLLALVLAAAGVAAWWLFARQHPGPAPLPLHEPEAQAPAPPPAPVEPLVVESEGRRGRELNAVDPAAGDLSGTRVEAAVDEKSAPVKLKGTLTDENTRQPLPEFELQFEVVDEGGPEAKVEGPNRSVACKTDAKGRFQCEDAILVARSVVHFLDRPGHKRLPPPWTIE